MKKLATQPTEAQIEKANKMASTGACSFEQALRMVMKADSKKGPQSMTKKDIEKMNIRNSESLVTRHSDDFYEEQTRNQAKSAGLTD